MDTDDARRSPRHALDVEPDLAPHVDAGPPVSALRASEEVAPILEAPLRPEPDPSLAARLASLFAPGHRARRRASR